MPDPVSVIDRNPKYLVIDKPAGLIMHANAFEKQGPFLADLLEEQLGVRPFTVNRLDRPVSGLMVLAFDKQTASELALQFSKREVGKRYTALVRGHAPDEWVSTRGVPNKKKGERREAESRIRCLNRYVLHESLGPYAETWFSLVEVELHTGRRHQARVHLKSARCPIIGDKAYGDKTINDNFSARFGNDSLFLRSTFLGFRSPVDGTWKEYRTGIPREWEVILESLEELPR